MLDSTVALTFTAESADAGQRLDHFLQTRLKQYSRARLQTWIRDGRVLVNGTAGKSSGVLHGGETIEVEPADLAPLRATAEDLPVEILYQDDAVIAINKPAGLVVHAGAGAHSGTLVNRLVHHFKSLSQVGGDLRPGIVHRLDRGTSGVLLVARTDAAHRALARSSLRARSRKTYLALVQGRVKSEHGRIEKPISRDPVHRTRMTARLGTGRAAITEFQVRERFEKFTYLEVRIGTDVRTRSASTWRASGIRRRRSPIRSDRRPADFSACLANRVQQPATVGLVAVEAPLPTELQEWLAEMPPIPPLSYSREPV
jgi:23S rRNA pseudouridine1911/1915/1917 synthase